jgi:hypothetical protein
MLARTMYSPATRNPPLQGLLSELPDPADLSLERGTSYQCTDVAIIFYLADWNGERLWRTSAGVALGAVALFFSPTGNDAANGLSPSTALRTFDRGVELLPWFAGNQVRWFPAAGTYAVWSDPLFLPIAVGPAGEPIVIDARAALVRGPQIGLTANDGFGAFLSFSALVTLPRGALVQLVTGANAGQYGSVAETAAGAASLLVALPNGPLAIGDKFVLVTSGVTIDATGSPLAIVGVNGGRTSIVLVGCKVRGSIDNSGAQLGLDRCDHDTVGTASFLRDGGRIVVGPGIDPVDVNVGEADAAGLFVHGVDGGGAGGGWVLSTGAQIGSPPFALAQIVAANSRFVASHGDLFVILNGSNSPVLFDACRGALVGFSSDVPGAVRAVDPAFTWNVGGVGPPSAAVTLADRADVEFLGDVSIESNLCTGLRVADGARCDAGDVRTDPARKNVGNGCLVDLGGTFYFDATTTLDGTVHQLSLEGDAYTLAAIAAAPVPAVLDGNGNLFGKQAVTDARGNTAAFY